FVRSGNPAEAWRWQEESLGRGLWEDLTARQLRPLTDVERLRLDDLYGRLNQVDKQLMGLVGIKEATAAQKQRRDDLLREYNQARSEWAQLQLNLEQLHGPAAGQVFSLSRIQKQLAANAALLVWLDVNTWPDMTDPQGDHWGCLVRASGMPIWV